MIRHHTVISGPGRAGTSFLVELLTHMDLDTGFDPDTVKDQKFDICNAGLEHDLRDHTCPYIVKTPMLCDYIDEVLADESIVIDHLVVPLRELSECAASRLAVYSKIPWWKHTTAFIQGRVIERPGSIWDAPPDQEMQESALAMKLHRLLQRCSTKGVPTTFMDFETMLSSPMYLLDRLRSAGLVVSSEVFIVAYEAAKEERP